jgi:hypothetical protein
VFSTHHTHAPNCLWAQLMFLHTLLCCPCAPVQNSSLVLTSDTRTRDAHEPTGEPETLAGRKMHKMGDRAQQQRPEGLSDKKGKGK